MCSERPVNSFRTKLISIVDDDYRLRKTIKHHELDFLDRKVEPLLKSKNEFAIRAGLVCLLGFYVDFDHLFLIFDRLEYLKEHDDYYVKMSLAWLLAECFIKYPDETFVYLQHSNLPKWTFNKAISKICDSRRITPETKTELKQLQKA